MNATVLTQTQQTSTKNAPSVSKTDAASEQKSVKRNQFESFNAFKEFIRDSFINGSGVDPELFDACVEFHQDFEELDGGEWEAPIHEALGWEYKKGSRSKTQPLYAAFLKNEDGSIWQAIVSIYDEDKDRPYRYFAPTNNGDRAFLPPVPYNFRVKIAKRYGISDVPEDGSFWEWLREQGIKIPLIITEGAKKALCGLSMGYALIALYGCQCGAKTKNKDGKPTTPYLIEDLQKFTLNPIWLLAFDRDNKAKAKKAVAAGRKRLKAALLTNDCLLFDIVWEPEEGKGLDDLVMNEGSWAWDAAYLKTIEKLEKQFKNDKNHSNTETKKISQSRMSKEIADKYRSKLAWHDGNKAWYWYEDKIPGTWTEVPEIIVGSLVFEELEQAIGLTFEHSKVVGTVRSLKYHLKLVEWEVMPGYVCLQDCVLDVNTLKTYPHQPGYRFLNSLPYKWSDRDIGCDKIKQWLLETCEGREEWVQVLRAAMKATVTERSDLQRYMELIGYGGSGKGTILRLVMQLVGKNNVAVTNLKQLENNRFETANFYGKKLIVITDSEQYTGDVSVLKKITGQDELRYEKKGVQQTSGFRFPGMVWIAANEAMQSKDYTSGLRRRRLSMPFNRVIPPHLRIDLEPEFKPFLSGLLAWVLEMPNSEVEEYVRNTDKKVKSLASYKEEVLLETNPVAQWADNCLYVNPDASTFVGNKTQDPERYLFANYSKWCSENGYTPLAHIRFSKTLVELFQTHLGNLDVTRHRGNKGTYIKGISLKLRGNQHLPNPITGNLEEAVTVSDSRSDSSVTDKVTAELPASDRFDSSDGCFIKNNDENNFQKNILDDFELRENGSQNKNVDELDKRQTTHQKQKNNELNKRTKIAAKPSQPSKPYTQSDTNYHTNRHSTVTDTVTPDNQTVTPYNSDCNQSPSPSEKSQSNQEKMVEVWDNQYELGKLVLEIPENELISITANYTPSQIKHIKDAANRAWQVGLNRDAEYNGERVEIMEAGNGSRQIKVRTQGGSLLKVKRGNLQPWLGI